VKILPILIPDSKLNSRSKINNKINPTNVEIKILSLFNNLILKNITPNLTLMYTNYTCSNTTELFKSEKILNILLNEELIEPKIKIIIAEYVSGGSFKDFIHKNTLPVKIWKSLLFGIIYTFAILQDLYEFMHYDCHLGNVLIDTSIDKKTITTYDYFSELPVFNVPCYGYMLKLWDYDFSTTFGGRKKVVIKNKKVETNEFASKSDQYGIRNKFNPGYDIHYMLNDIYQTNNTPDTVLDFIEDIIPLKFLGHKRTVNKKIAVNNSRLQRYYPEIPTPFEIIQSDFFSEFRA
jgi:hypothetical protein